MTEDTDSPQRAYTVGSVARALRLIDIVSESPADGVTLTALAKSLGTSKSTAYALARTLVDAGYLRPSSLDRTIDSA
jgi:DNA-binding IclR family transcriptional regulator